MQIKVEAKSDGNVALAEVRLYGDAFGFKVATGSQQPTVVALGSAKRHPEDSNDQEVGMALATARAFQALGKKLERAAHGHVKHRDDMKAKREERKILAIFPGVKFDGTRELD